MSPRRVSLGGASIFRHSLGLAVGSAFMLAVASIGLVLLVPAPIYFPVSTFEVARLVRGEPIARTDERFLRVIQAHPPAAAHTREATSQILGKALASNLGVKPEDVQFQLLPLWNLDPVANAPQRRYDEIIIKDVQVYGDAPNYSPLVFGSFQASVRQPDGRWVTVARLQHDDDSPWQVGLLSLIGIALVLILPVVWWFSRRLALPIREFAAAADRIGNGDPEPVRVHGPHEIRIAAAAMNAMQSRLDAYVKQRTAVVGAIAHDLRTPLARLAFLLTSMPDPMREKIQRELDGMERMVAVTLDFVRSEAVPQQREPIDLKLLVEGVIDDAADRGAQATLQTSSAESLVITGDSQLLSRMVANLVSNALTYGGAAMAHLRNSGDSAIIEICDNGPGMRDADLARAFEPFFRAETSRNIGTGGMGLGLAIVQSIARAHGGDVSLENRTEGGLRVTVRLPLRAAPARSA